MIAPDEKTVAYLAGRPRAPSGAAWDRAVARWRELRTDPGATYDKQVELDASTVAPQVTWGTSPGMVTPDRKSTRLNSSHVEISYAVFCLKKQKNTNNRSHIEKPSIN